GDGTDTIAPEPDLGVQQPGTGDGGVETPAAELNISNSGLVDVDGNTITSIDLEGAYYEVQVMDGNDEPVANAKVTFSIDADGVVLS
ncbi:hypothetical protein R2R70_21305, partial [Cobetia sp. SIMBA_158]